MTWRPPPSIPFAELAKAKLPQRVLREAVLTGKRYPSADALKCGMSVARWTSPLDGASCILSFSARLRSGSGGGPRHDQSRAHGILVMPSNVWVIKLVVAVFSLGCPPPILSAALTSSCLLSFILSTKILRCQNFVG